MTNNFNEDEFAIHFFTNLNTSSEPNLIPCRRPTLREEGKLGYDMKVNLGDPGIPIFIQFKSPNRINDTEKAEIRFHTSADAPELDLCISFRKNDKFKQHKMLRKIVKNVSPSFAYYTSPRFCSRDDLMTAFQEYAVHLKSAFFCVNDIGPIKDNGKKKSICYSMVEEYALIYPICRSIELRDFNNIAELAGAKIDTQRRPFSCVIDDLLNYLQRHYDISLPRRTPLLEHIDYASHEGSQFSNFLIANSMAKERGEIDVNKYNEGNDVGYSTKLKYLADFLHDKLNVELCVYQHASLH